MAVFLKKIILYVGILFSAVLTVITFLFTTRITNYDVGTGEMLITFAPYIILGAILFICLFSVPKIREKIAKIGAKKMAWYAFFWGLCASIAWVFIADVRPMWDSLDLSYAAEFLAGSRDPLAVGKWTAGVGSYMERFPFQTPIALLIYFCMKFAGSNYVILFELLNCIACAFTMYYIVKLTDALFKNKTATFFSGVFIMLFTPLILYCTFLYGNTLCLPFIAACFFFQKLALDTIGTEKKSFRRYLILSIICGVFASFVKSTMFIACIASGLIWLIAAMQHKEKRCANIIAAIAVIILAKFCITPFNFLLEKVANDKINLHNGAPMIAWIAMGTGAGKEYAADLSGNEDLRTEVGHAGYYDGFVWALNGEEYSPKALSALSKEYIGKRLEHYASDPGLAVSYFANKLAIEWTEPTFESLLASNWCISGDETANSYVMCRRPYTVLARSFYYGKMNVVLNVWMDILQSLLPLGLVVCLFKLRKKIAISQLAPLAFILGGAAVYLLWENKTQYMVPFYLFMIPYAGMGWNVILQRFAQSRIAGALYSRSKSSQHIRQLDPKKSSESHRATKSNK